MIEIETRYEITLQAADGRERTVTAYATSEERACDKAVLRAKRETPLDSHGKASEWRVLRVQ